VAVALQQGWDFAIPMSPHCSAIFLQHSRSADVFAAPGNMQAATGSAASISASAETPTLINNLNITSLSTTDSMTQQAGKGFTLPRRADRSTFNRIEGILRDRFQVVRFHGIPDENWRERRDSPPRPSGLAWYSSLSTC
jgi:hypothetical protein